MMLRKVSSADSTTLPWTKSKIKDNHHSTLSINNPQIRYSLFVSFFLALWFLVLLSKFPRSVSTTYNNKSLLCDGTVSVYIYDLPSRFNLGLLTHCDHLNVYTNMCPHVANHGLGQPIPNYMGLSSSATWFSTHQFLAEMIFHARVSNHPCRTWDPNNANLFYVPFYAGLYASSMFRQPNLTLRDSLALDLTHYLQSQPTWHNHNGKDHFLAMGRTAWDFMRSETEPDFGANVLLNLPTVRNMSVLTVERTPWDGDNQYGIPYPSYYHPTSVLELMTWQKMMRDSKRPYLFSFVGGARKGVEKAAVRAEIMKQCEKSMRCMVLKCGSDGLGLKCHEPKVVLDAMTKSEFCLQAPGDSFTRRSVFDSIMAGCIPVYFSPHTAYTQYGWYMEAERKEEYSVYIDEKGEGRKMIEKVLMEIPREKVKRMREEVISMIPRITYAHPNASDVGFQDAVDVALVNLARIVQEKISGESKSVMSNNKGSDLPQVH